MKFKHLKYIPLITQVAFVMVIPIFLCFFVGIYLDEKLGTSPLFLVVFILLGVGASFRNLFKIILSKGVENSDKQ